MLQILTETEIFDVVVGASTGRALVLMNQGGGRLVDETASRLPSPSRIFVQIALGDVDGDGDIDMMMAGGTFQLATTFDSLYLNDGSGVFTDVTATHMPFSPGFSGDVVLVDLDEDGDLDAIVANTYVPGLASGQNNIYLNDGTGHFTDVTATWLPATSDGTIGIALGDVDGDQDLDIVFGNTGAVRIQNLLFINHQRQAEPRLPATVGQTYTVDFHGDPGLVASLVVGVRAASFSLVPFGTLGLDPAASFVLPVSAAISAQGKATIRMPIPKAPSLVGSQFLTQGVLLDPQNISRSRLLNVVREVIR